MNSPFAAIRTLNEESLALATSRLFEKRNPEAEYLVVVGDEEGFQTAAFENGKVVTRRKNQAPQEVSYDMAQKIADSKFININKERIPTHIQTVESYYIRLKESSLQMLHSLNEE